jgi:uncharacterized protein (DUF433 family)
VGTRIHSEDYNSFITETKRALDFWCIISFTKNREEYMPDIIEKNPKVLGGQPVIKGTRVPVARIMGLIALDYSLKDLKKEIPHLDKLTKEDIVAILDFYKHQISI